MRGSTTNPIDTSARPSHCEYRGAGERQLVAQRPVRDRGPCQRHLEETVSRWALRAEVIGLSGLFGIVGQLGGAAPDPPGGLPDQHEVELTESVTAGQLWLETSWRSP